jgi:hypothetical protein
MNSPSNSFGQKQILNSIGTETSENDNHQRQQQQQDGGFLSFLFGSDTETDANMTELIMCALEKGRVDVADFLLEKRFTPDLTKVSKHGDNLMHLLVKYADRSKNISKALYQLITNTNFKELLNKPNKYGDTPLHIAVKNKIFDVANLMIDNGAVRTLNNEKFEIVTDYEDKDEEEIVRNIPIITTRLSEDDNTRNPRDSIFAKQQSQSLNQNMDLNSVPTVNNELIAEIVKAFKTASDTDTTREITRTDIPSERYGRKIISERRKVSEPMISERRRVSEPMNPIENLDSAMDSDMFVQHIAKKIMGEQEQMDSNNIVGGARTREKVQGDKKNKKVTGKRVMKTFSELSDQMELFGGSDEDVLKNISRAQVNQKDKLHELAEEKILNLLPKKDKILAKAVKSIIYNEIKEKKPQLNGLDRADELNKMITQKKVDEVLAQKDLIKERVDQIEKRAKERDEKFNNKKEKGIKFESSVSDSSDSDSDDINTSDDI